MHTKGHIVPQVQIKGYIHFQNKDAIFSADSIHILYIAAVFFFILRVFLTENLTTCCNIIVLLMSNHLFGGDGQYFKGK